MSPPARPLPITLQDGTILDGELHLPDSDTSNAPALIMSHGFSATRTMGLGWFAESFARAGYVVYVYDHRGFGTSGGVSRSIVDPWVQAHDMWEVIDQIRGLGEIHPDRLALWGSSFSAGVAIALGALHPEIRAVIANVPFAGSGDLMAAPSHAHQRFQAMRIAFDNDTLDVGQREVGPMPVVLDDSADHAFLPQPESAEWFLTHGPSNGWTNLATLALTTTPPFDPGACSPELDGTALLMVVATDDQVAPTSVAIDTYERASGPKRLAMVDGHHFCVYEDPVRHEALEVMIDFLDEFL